MKSVAFCAPWIISSLQNLLNKCWTEAAAAGEGEVPVLEAEVGEEEVQEVVVGVSSQAMWYLFDGCDN